MNRFTPSILALALGLGCAADGAPVTGAGTNGPQDPGAAMRAAHPGLCAPANAFSYALCTCDDLTQLGGLKVGTGPSGEGSVGVNGLSSVANASDVSGSWVSWQQWTAGTGSKIGGSLRSGANLLVAGAVSVGKDLAVKQNLGGAGYLTVGGDLRVGGVDLFLGYRKIDGGRAPFDAPAQPPCGCDPGTVFDVAGAVAAAAAMNDNAARGLAAGGQIDIGVQHLVLETGRYYLRGVHNIGAGALDIRGNVSLYIDGSLDEIGAQAIRLATGATLDLYVSGAVRLVGFTPLGDPRSPASFRLFVGGSDRVSISAGLQEFFGSIYAPTADIAMAGVTVVTGSLFARSVIDAGVLIVNHGGATPGCTPPVDVGAPPPPPPKPSTPAPPAVVE